MERKLIIGLISACLGLLSCGVVVLLTGITGWLLISQPGELPKLVKVTPLLRVILPSPIPPSATPVPGLPKSYPTNTPTPLATEQAKVNIPTMTPTASPTILPTNTPDIVAETLGFPLPIGSVNSVTKQGIATKLVIPKLNLDRPIKLALIENQTWQVENLGQAVGHLEGTAPPGSNSNIVLVGHVTISKGVYGPFAGLSLLATGDEVIVYQNEQAYRYQIDSSETVERTAVDVTYPSVTGQITLITCSQWDKAAGRYINRLVVKGHLLE